MLEILVPYELTFWCFLVVGGLILVQLLVADVVGLRGGHVPGTAVTSTHSDFHFRATRAHANTNETVSAFILLALGGIALGSSSAWMNMFSAVYCGARIAHMLLYWFNLSTLRSVSFVVSLVALIGLLVVGLSAVEI